MRSGPVRSFACAPTRRARTCSTPPPARAWRPDSASPDPSAFPTTKETRMSADNRRKFLKKASAGAAAVSVPMLWPAAVHAQQWS
ncbi:MAG: twin-arginine translocation signal domain-containing protein, partial [Ramlibacter sp.]